MIPKPNTILTDRKFRESLSAQNHYKDHMSHSYIDKSKMY